MYPRKMLFILNNIFREKEENCRGRIAALDPKEMGERGGS